MRSVHRLARSLSAVVLVAGCGPQNARIPVSGEVAGKLLHTTVDQDVARYYVESFLAGKSGDAALDQALSRLGERYRTRLPSEDELAALSRTYSVDFATLFFAHELSRQLASRRFEANLAAAERLIQTPRGLRAPWRDYAVLLTPAWLYEDKPETGANLLLPQRALEQAGVHTTRVASIQDGTVEENAQIIAAAIRRAGKTAEPLVLISVSKASAETALALTLLDAAERRHVKAWINIGGAFCGTPLADVAFSFPNVVATYPLFWSHGWDIASIETLRPAVRASGCKTLAAPPGVFVLNYVGAPLAADLTELGESGYVRLADRGPNDGVVLTRDAVVPGATTVVALGLDHYLNYPDMDRRVVAVYEAIVMLLEDLRPGCRRASPEVALSLSGSAVPRRQVSLPTPAQVLRHLTVPGSDRLALPYVE